MRWALQMLNHLKSLSTLKSVGIEKKGTTLAHVNGYENVVKSGHRLCRALPLARFNRIFKTILTRY